MNPSNLTTKTNPPIQTKQHDTKLIAKALLEIYGSDEHYAKAKMEGGKVNYTHIKAPLTQDLIERHLAGKITLGSYCLSKANTVTWLGWDVDSTDLEKARDYTQQIIGRLGSIPYKVEFSGKKGYHVIVVLTHPLNAGKAKQITEAVRGNLPASGETHVEIFPKQAQRTTTSPEGSLIKIPLCVHPETKQRSRFIDPRKGWEEGDALDPLEHLSNHRVEPKSLDVLLTLRNPEGLPAQSSYTPLGQPLSPGNRNDSIFNASLRLGRGGVSKDWALATARTWAKGQPDFPDSEIVQTVENAYKRLEQKKNLKDYCIRNEFGDAELFALMFRDRVIYDHAAKAWYFWLGNYWERDSTKSVNELVANDLAAEYRYAASEQQKAGTAEDAKFLFNRAGALMQRARTENVLSFASGLAGMKLKGDEWDTDPMILGVNNGVIDLTNGQFRTSGAKEYLKAHSPTDWKGIDCTASTWEKFLLEILGDKETVDFIQRVFGYAITGKTTEHCLPILWGADGFNGKTTLLEVISKVLGKDLAYTTPAETLMETKQTGGGANPFVYALQGKRLVWATESKEGQKLNSSLVKLLTGGDSITTRRLHENAITFQPTHTIMLLTNDKPHINIEDQALCDRIMLIDFQMRFVDKPKKKNEKKKDPDMAKKLETEASGILAWLVKGCLKWQAEGLKPTERVKVATSQYQEDEDTVGDFIGDCLIDEIGVVTYAQDIYAAYKGWAIKSGMNPMTAKAWNKRLQKRFESTETKGERGARYKDVRLKNSSSEWGGREVDLARTKK